MTRTLFDDPTDDPSSNPVTTESTGKSGAYRILHSADWHLGKLLGDYSREQEHERFLQWLLSTIREQNIDALIVAGDVFDSARPPQTAVRQYYEFLANLYRETAGSCRVIITAGNHDSPAHLDAPREILKALNATVVGHLPENMSNAIVPLPDADHPQVIVAALPFLRDGDLRTGRPGQSADEIRADLRNGISARYEQALAACENSGWENAAKLAVGHLTVQGAKNSDSERDIHIGGLGTVDTDTFPPGFEYVALGHLHRPQSIDEDARVCYSGSPIPLSFSESTDKKSVRLLDFEHGKLIRNEKIPIPVERYMMQLRAHRDDLETTLRESEVLTADLPTWIELIVETSDASENVTQIAREIAADLPFEITRVIAQMTGEQVSLKENELPDASIDELLDNPIDVFDRLLEQRSDLGEDDIAALRIAFAELRDAELASADERPAAKKSEQKLGPSSTPDAGGQAGQSETQETHNQGGAA